MADEVLQSGYLHKFQQKIMRSWQKKWCVLSLSQQDDGKPAFHIYDSKEQVGKENTKRKTVYLDRSTCVGIVKNKHKEYYFEIITNDASTQGFAADSREDLDKWVLAMNNAASGVTGTARNIVILSKESTSVSDAPVSAAESSPSPSVYISEENMAYSSIE
ncbi:src kinase-associated phosphoprotein 2-like, partial [Saccoglossus kowalevskii]